MSWVCPKCQHDLIPKADNSGLYCEQNHQFDYAKQGYVNLLLADQKSSKAPGDSAQMIQARHAFLAQGFYDPLVDELGQIISTHHGVLDKNTVSWFDCGCGEGYYTRHLAAKSHKAVSLFGLDISKAAVKKAASTYKQMRTQQTVSDARYSVASSFNIPLKSASMDMILSVFSPFDEQEVARVLNQSGIFIRVLPNALHLKQLKSALYATPVAHKTPKPLQGLSKLSTHAVTFDCNMGAQTLSDLHAMTPFNFTAVQSALPNVSQRDKNQDAQNSQLPSEQSTAKSLVNHIVDNQPHCVMTCDFFIEVFGHDNG